MKTKKMIALLLCVIMAFSLVACSASDTPAAENGEWEWKERLEIVVASGEGGGLDVTARKFATYLEEELGTNITILNKADVVTSTYDYCYTAENEGYMFMFIGPTAFIVDAAGMIQDFSLREEVVPVSGLVQAEGVFFSRKDAPWSNAEELIAYMKENPGKVTCAVDSPTGIAGAIVREFEQAAGVQFDWITSLPAEGFISAIAGDVDVCINTWSDAGAYVESGDLQATLLMAQNRNPAFETVTCAGDLDLPSTLGFYRVFAAMKGCPQAAIDALTTAIHAAAQNPEWIEWLNANGLTNDYVWTPEVLQTMIDETYASTEVAG